MGNQQTETCGNCGATIGKLETPMVWKGSVVCDACHKRLSQSAKPDTTPVPGIGQRDQETILQPQTKKTWFLRHKILTGVMIVFILSCMLPLILAPFIATAPVNLQKGNQSAAPQATEQTVSHQIHPYPATIIYEAYHSNEVKGAMELKGRWFVVTGVIGSIGTDFTGTPYVAFRPHEGKIFSVQCMFSRRPGQLKSLAKLAKGQEVSILGNCSGIMGNVLFHHCKVVADTELTAPVKVKFARTGKGYEVVSYGSGGELPTTTPSLQSTKPIPTPIKNDKNN
ncbi:MAG: OB-fold protein [Phycisphaerae bacterium]